MSPDVVAAQVDLAWRQREVERATVYVDAAEIVLGVDDPDRDVHCKSTLE